MKVIKGNTNEIVKKEFDNGDILVLTNNGYKYYKQSK